MPYNKISEKLRLQFEEIVGKAYCFNEKEIIWTYAFGGAIFEKEWMPELILMPQNSEQVSKILKLANKKRIPVTPRGTGTSLSAGTQTPYGGIVLELSQMKKILSISIQDNLVEVEPGVVCDDLNEVLAPSGYFFPPDPGSSTVATIGGMVGNNSGGIQAFKYGVTKNYVLYLEIVLVDGRILTLGSGVLKSVSSYNLKDLFIASEGTLGVITKIGLRIRPLPEKRKLGFFIFDDIDDLTQAVIEIREKGIVPNLLEFLDKQVMTAVYDYLGGEFKTYPEGNVLLAEVDGKNEKAVEEDFAAMFDIIIRKNPKFHKIAKTPEEREALIEARKKNLPALSRLAPTICVEDCTVQISKFAEVVKKIWEIPEKINAPNIGVATIAHMEGNLHPTFMLNENNEKDVEDFERAIDYLYEEIVVPAGGTITGEHGVGKIKSPYFESELGNEVAKLTSQIKKMFDPRMILNPGTGKGDNRELKKIKQVRKLKKQSDSILELNCMRCGFCTVTCPSRIYHMTEAYSPRGRLSLLNGLVHGEIELNDFINDIFNACTLCGLCLVKCPAGVQTFQIFEKTREIIHKSYKNSTS